MQAAEEDAVTLEREGSKGGVRGDEEQVWLQSIDPKGLSIIWGLRVH